MMRFALRGTLALAVLWICSSAALTSRAVPDVTRMKFTPPVVPENYAQAVTFEATVTGGPPSVAFRYNGSDRPMFDDGTHGDSAAGDGVWTIQFDPNEILGKLTSGYVQRPFIGFCIPSGGGQFNVFAEIWTSAIGLAAVRPVSSTMQETDYVVNMTASAAEIQSQYLLADLQVLTRRFFARYPDTADFMSIVFIGGRRANRGHYVVRNTVTGIGMPPIDTAASLGAGNVLKGLTIFPIPTGFDSAGDAFNHELGHQWMVSSFGTALASSSPHWPRGNIAGNVMGFSIAGSNVGGRYPYTFTANGQGGYVVGNSNASIYTLFNSMELYLMGLVPPEQAGTYFVLNDQTYNVSPGEVLQPSQITHVSVSDVIASAGARAPDSTRSQRLFRTSTLIVSEQLLDSYAMSLYDWFARRVESTETLACSDGLSQSQCKPFFLATGNRASVKARLITAGFTDDPLVAGVSAIKRVHVTELRARIDAVRATYGLAGFGWTDSAVVAGVTTIKAAHVTELRTALAQAYAAAGQQLPDYTDPSLTAGVIKAIHIVQLRAALLAIE
jgi:hypothetical protein